jgi:hypothetical protein
MKIAERFRIEASQFELDFVNIDTDRDLPLFVDPYFMETRNDAFSVAATRTLRNFFQTLVNHIRANQLELARHLFDFLHEPNETCLGVSSDKPRGNAIGDVDGEKLFQSIVHSRAVIAGIVENIQDFKLFIPGIDKDKISDLTTNVIRYHLIKYTQNQCALWGIPLVDNVQSGFFWDSALGTWRNEFERMLVVDEKPILLTPKSVVSYSKLYTPQKYYSKFVLEFLQHEHVAALSALVQYRRDGTPYVTKKSLGESVAPYSKDFLTTFTERHPEVFREFKEWVKARAKPLRSDEIIDEDRGLVTAFLIDRLNGIPAGGEQATVYHRTAVGILELLFYPDLISPVVEQEIHEGRKRIDITFDNAATDGFFFRMHNTHQTPCQYIFVECKNYSKDVGNPELDQLAGRFSVNRGKVGLLLFRRADQMNGLIARCRDTYIDHRGTILPLSDVDLIDMLRSDQQGTPQPYEQLLSNRLRQIVLG